MRTNSGKKGILGNIEYINSMFDGNYRDENASDRKKKYIEEYRFRYGVESIKMPECTFKPQIDKKSALIASRRCSKSPVVKQFSSPKNQI